MRLTYVGGFWVPFEDLARYGWHLLHAHDPGLPEAGGGSRHLTLLGAVSVYLPLSVSLSVSLRRNK